MDLSGNVAGLQEFGLNQGSQRLGIGDRVFLLFVS
jgi:hypothetical protein